MGKGGPDVPYRGSRERRGPCSSVDSGQRILFQDLCQSWEGQEGGKEEKLNEKRRSQPTDYLTSRRNCDGRKATVSTGKGECHGITRGSSRHWKTLRVSRSGDVTGLD